MRQTKNGAQATLFAVFLRPGTCQEGVFMAMAGTIHEAESASLLAQIEQESAAAARQLAEAAHLRKGQIVVVGCSTSEVVGRRVGSWSTPEVGQAVY